MSILLFLSEHSYSIEKIASTSERTIKKNGSYTATKEMHNKNYQALLKSSKNKQSSSVKKDSILLKRNSNKIKLLLIFSSGA